MHTIDFAAEGQGLIEADLYPADGADAVVLCHGRNFDKGTFRPQAQAWAAAGLTCLALNFRGYGRSSGDSGELAPGERFSPRLASDVLAAVRHLRGLARYRGVHVVGASMGGFAAALAATLAGPAEERIDRLALLSPVGIERPEAIRAERILYVASKEEPMAASIHDQYARAPQPKELLLLPGAAHAQHIFAGASGGRLLDTLSLFLLQSRAGVSNR